MHENKLIFINTYFLRLAYTPIGKYRSYLKVSKLFGYKLNVDRYQ